MRGPRYLVGVTLNLLTLVSVHRLRVVIGDELDRKSDIIDHGHIINGTDSHAISNTNNLTRLIEKISAKARLTGADDDNFWDYEPRLWSFDGPESLANDHDTDIQVKRHLEDNWAVDNEPDEDEEFSAGHDQIGHQARFFGTISHRIQETARQIEPPPRDPHEQHYFAGSSRENHFAKIGSSSRTGNSKHSQTTRFDPTNRLQSLDECNQFRVDVRETIICDKKRCDKLDFELPKYDNQISIIQTTRDGMRFKQIDLAMATGQRPAKLKGATTCLNNRQSRSSNHPAQEIPKNLAISHSQRVKIDIFDFLKPKPSSSTTTVAPSSTTSTPAPSSSTAKPDDPSTTPSDHEVTTPTTEEPDDDLTTTTTAPGSSSTTTTQASNIQPDDDDQNQVNRTRFVTTLRLDTRRLKQKMIGFGGALSDATCRNIKSLSPQMADSLMEDYFGARGLRYNIARLSIGSSDFSTTPYTNNDKPGVGGPTIEEANQEFIVVGNKDHLREARSRWHQLNRQKWGPISTNRTTTINRQHSNSNPSPDDDVEMKNFHLVSEDLDFKIPIVRQAIATSTQRELKLFASMWSPPIWMKNNSHIVHGYLKGDVYGPYYRGMAELMLRWLEAYRKEGIEFWAFTGLNEPVTGIQPFIFHNSLGITKRDYLIFLKLYLGPMLRKRNFEQVKLMLLDDNKGFAPNYVKSALQDPQLASMISGIAYHWYMNDEYENLDFISRDYPDKFLISSEASNGYLPFQVHTLPGDWDRGVAYMIDILSGIKHSSSGWVDWNMVLDLGGGPSWAHNNLDAPIIVNGERDEYYKSPMFYALGHFSRFVEPDSRRLDQILSYARFDLPLDAVAFLTPKNYIVIVALNANRASIPFKVIVNKRLIRQISLRPQSFTTIVFKAPPQVTTS